MGPTEGAQTPLKWYIVYAWRCFVEMFLCWRQELKLIAYLDHMFPLEFSDITYYINYSFKGEVYNIEECFHSVNFVKIQIECYAALEVKICGYLNQVSIL